MGFYAFSFLFFYLPMFLERTDNFTMKRKLMVCKPKDKLLGKSLYILPPPPDMYASFSLHLSSCFSWVPRPFLINQKALLEVVTVPFPLSTNQQGFWTLRDQFNLSPVLLSTYSHFPWVCVFNHMLLLLYKVNETIASVSRSLWVYSINEDDLARAHSNPPQMTALVTEQDVSTGPGGTKLQMLSTLSHYLYNPFL